MNTKTSTSSQLPKVLLQANPGLSRQLDEKLDLLDKLKHKNDVTIEAKKKKIKMMLFQKIDRRLARRSKLDKETRKEIEAFKLNSKSSKGNNFRDKKERPVKADHRIGDHQSRPGSSTSQWESSILGGSEWEGTIGGRGGDADGSRRSSLRSTSYMELEGMLNNHLESPDPSHTEDPLPGLPNEPGGTSTAVGGSGTRQTSAAGSRRSSLSSSLMPEVVVTQPVRKGSLKDEDPSPPTDESKLTAPDRLKIWNLLPAPTPTRFVGKMHAVVSSPEKRKTSRSESFSRRSSIAVETIKEDEVMTLEKSASPFEEDSIFHDKKDGDDHERKITNELPSGIQTSARFMGKISKSIKEEASRATSSASNVKRSSWKSAVQHSFESSTGISGGISRSKSPMKKMFTQISSAQAIKKAASLTNRKRVSHEGFEDSFRVGDSHLRFFERDGQDIMLSFGREPDDLRIHREPEHELPGMKKGFVLEHLDKGNEKVKGGDTNGLDMSHDGTGNDHEMTSIMSVTGRFKRVTGTRPGSGDISSIGDIVKGMQTTSKLVGKLSSLRAAGSRDEDGVGMKREPDAEDKWDWMTGVPTSIRFLAKSWRHVARGPGGIVVDTPNLQVSKLKAPDFSGTVNMLTVLAKADLKLKSQMKEDDSGNDKDANDSRRNAGKQRLTPQSQRRPKSKASSNTSNLTGRHTSSSQKTESDSLESEEMAKKIFEDLFVVDTPAIPKWNVDVSVREDSGGKPILLKQPFSWTSSSSEDCQDSSP